MYANRSIVALFLALACATTVLARSAYNAPKIIVDLPELGEAQAQAISDATGASAAASRMDQVNFNKLLQYGHEIGKPLLVRPIPPITGLHGAALQPRVLVARLEPAFLKTKTGKLIFNGESTLAVVAA